MPPDGGSISWRLGGGGRGVLEELTSLVILSCVSEYLEGGREKGRKRGKGGREGREGGREGGSRYIYTHTVYNSDHSNLSLH